MCLILTYYYSWVSCAILSNHLFYILNFQIFSQINKKNKLVILNVIRVDVESFAHFFTSIRISWFSAQYLLTNDRDMTHMNQKSIFCCATYYVLEYYFLRHTSYKKKFTIDVFIYVLSTVLYFHQTNILQLILLINTNGTCFLIKNR